MRILVVYGDIEQGSTVTSVADRAAQQDAYLKMDMYRIEQVVRNLVTNAVNNVPTIFFHSMVYVYAGA